MLIHFGTILLQVTNDIRKLTNRYRYVWYAGIALGACSIISAFFIHNYSELMVSEVSRKMMLSAKEVHPEESTSENDGVFSPNDSKG